MSEQVTVNPFDLERGAHQILLSRAVGCPNATDGGCQGQDLNNWCSQCLLMRVLGTYFAQGPMAEPHAMLGVNETRYDKSAVVALSAGMKLADLTSLVLSKLAEDDFEGAERDLDAVLCTVRCLVNWAAPRAGRPSPVPLERLVLEG